MADIRLTSGWYIHPKVRKLKKRLGSEGVVALLTLWSWTGENRPSGILSGMDDEDIGIAAQWSGDEKLLVSTFVELRLLDKDRKIHNWEKNNPYVCESANRKEKARQAAKARWCKEAPALPLSSPATNNQSATKPDEPTTLKPAAKPTEEIPPIFKGCQHFRASDQQLATAKKTWLANENHAGDFELAIQEVDLWLQSESVAAKKARSAKSHTRHLYAAWVLENIERRKKANGKSQAKNLSRKERETEFLQNFIAELEEQEQQPINVTPGE